MAANPEPISRRRLDSWKQIADFLGRAERTAKRWEAERGLPIHRVPGRGRGAVFAYTSELAEWLKGRGPELEGDESGSSKAVGISAASSSLAVVEPARGLPAPDSTATNLIGVRVAVWIIPLALAAGLVVYFSAGHGSFRFKALAGRHVPSADAQELYLKGRYFWERRTPDDLNRAIDYFTQAIVKDPSDAQAYVGLADCYNLLREFGAMPRSEAYPRALSAAQRAVELDNSSAEAHSSLAFVSFWWSWHGVTAEREFKRALELDPTLVRAHHWYATYLMGLHRYTEALDQIKQAQGLEPSSTAILADKGLLLWMVGSKEDGLSLLSQLATTQPSFSSVHDYLARIYVDQKDYPKAIVEWRRLAEFRHDNAGLDIADAREKGFASGGLQGLLEAQLPLQKEMADSGTGSAYEVAVTYGALGKKPEALTYLQMALDRHEESMLTGDPQIPGLRDDPQYQRFRTQVGQRLAE